MAFNGTNNHSIGFQRQDLRRALLSAVDEVLKECRPSQFNACGVSSPIHDGTAISYSFYPATTPTMRSSEQLPTSLSSLMFTPNCLSSLPLQSLLLLQQEQNRCYATPPALSSTSFLDFERSGMTHSGSSSGNYLGRSLQEALLLPRLQDNSSLSLSLPQLYPSSRTSNLEHQGHFEQQPNQRILLQSLNLPNAHEPHLRDPVSLFSQLTSDWNQRQREAVSRVTEVTQQDLQIQQNTAMRTLVAIGSRARKRTDPFIDVLSLNLPPAPTGPARTRLNETFPEKLHRMLRESDGDCFSDIVSFLPHGRAFAVHDIERFVQDILPRYFPHQTKWRSFTRQLNFWGFLTIQSGPDAGSAAATRGLTSGGRFAVHHELFLQSRPDLCLYIRRVGRKPKIEGNSEN